MPLLSLRFGAFAAIWLTLTLAAPAALGDAAAGRAAFEKGDYRRAMAEWATTAQSGDRDAEFGLGNLHERGDGDLPQNYKKAEEWYQKAADHNHVGALYRLALIRSAGGDDLPADLVEAYKWILLASEKVVVTDIKTQLEQVIDRAQQAEGQKRATAWKEARAAKAAEPPAPTPTTAPSSGGTAAPAIPPPRQGPTPSTTTASGGKSGGCPGWPFPTLPCTEQFPALPGAPAARAPPIPPPRSPAN
jgi:uncharacterized protein